MPETIPFREMNFTFVAPKGQEASCNELQVHKGAYPDGTPVIISKWRFTTKEIAEIIANGNCVFLHIIGDGMPPVNITTKDPFK